MRFTHIILLVLLASLSASCAAQYGHNILPPAEGMASFPYGIYVRVENDHRADYEGELIAFDSDTIFVAGSSGLLSFPAASTRMHGSIFDRGSVTTNYLLLTLLGVVASASTGFGAIIVAPLYLITGIASAIIVSHINALSYDPSSWAQRNEVVKWARYPAGMPHEIDRSKIRMFDHPRPTRDSTH